MTELHTKTNRSQTEPNQNLARLSQDTQNSTQIKLGIIFNKVQHILQQLNHYKEYQYENQIFIDEDFLNQTPIDLEIQLEKENYRKKQFNIEEVFAIKLSEPRVVQMRDYEVQTQEKWVQRMKRKVLGEKNFCEGVVVGKNCQSTRSLVTDFSSASFLCNLQNNYNSSTNYTCKSSNTNSVTNLNPTKYMTHNLYQTSNYQPYQSPQPQLYKTQPRTPHTPHLSHTQSKFPTIAHQKTSQKYKTQMRSLRTSTEHVKGLTLTSLSSHKNKNKGKMNKTNIGEDSNRCLLKLKPKLRLCNTMKSLKSLANITQDY